MTRLVLWASLVACMMGPGRQACIGVECRPWCLCRMYDLDNDGDVDLRDVAAWSVMQ